MDNDPYRDLVQRWHCFGGQNGTQSDVGRYGVREGLHLQSCDGREDSLYWNNASGALTFNLPSLATFDFTQDNTVQFCFRNLPTKTGAITIQLPSNTYMGVDGVNGSAAGTLVSSGAIGDSVCVVGVDSTHYTAYVGYGIWTNN